MNPRSRSAVPLTSRAGPFQALPPCSACLRPQTGLTVQKKPPSPCHALSSSQEQQSQTSRDHKQPKSWELHLSGLTTGCLSSVPSTTKFSHHTSFHSLFRDTAALLCHSAVQGGEPSAKSGCAAPFQALLFLPSGEHRLARQGWKDVELACVAQKRVNLSEIMMLQCYLVRAVKYRNKLPKQGMDFPALQRFKAT